MNLTVKSIFFLLGDLSLWRDYKVAFLKMQMSVIRTEMASYLHRHRYGSAVSLQSAPGCH